MTERKWPYTGPKAADSRKWTARVVWTDEAASEPAYDSLIQIDLIFMSPDLDTATAAVQGTMEALIPGYSRDLLRIEYIRLWEGDRGGRPRRERPEGQQVDIHSDRGHFTLVEGREYVLVTMIPGVERSPRQSRMAFLGAKAGPGPKYLQFSARGPDRTHQGQYGGTQEVHERSLLYVQEVERDEAARYCCLTAVQLSKLHIRQVELSV